MTFPTVADEYKALNCEGFGLPIDSPFSHIPWLRPIIEEIEYEGN